MHTAAYFYFFLFVRVVTFENVKCCLSKIELWKGREREQKLEQLHLFNTFQLGCRLPNPGKTTY